MDLDIDVPTVYDGDHEDLVDDIGKVVTEDETLGILRGLGRGSAATKEERLSVVPPQNSPNLDIVEGTAPDLIDLTEPQDGFTDQLSPVSVREQRVAKARRVLGLKASHQQVDRGDQADAGAAEDHRTTDITKVLQALHHNDDSIVRKAIQRLHIKWYHAETERLQTILRAAGAPARACNMVPQVVQGCQVCRP